jgi:hypothetical protein
MRDRKGKREIDKDRGREKCWYREEEREREPGRVIKGGLGTDGDSEKVCVCVCKREGEREIVRKG